MFNSAIRKKKLTQKKKNSRRDFLRISGIGAAAALSNALLGACGTDIDENKPAADAAAFETSPDAEVVLTAAREKVQIFPGEATRVWRYRGEVRKGDPSILAELPGSYLGPVFRIRKGQWIRIHFQNELPEQSIIHWHGLHVPPEMDGHPIDAVSSGQSYPYAFQVQNRAGTYWFHPHPHTLTGPQVYRGLAGLFLISDEEEEALGMPEGEFDVPLIIQDRTFTEDNQLVYLPGGMMDRMMGFLGDQILVNGQPDFELSVAASAYRLRLLNGSNSRIYKLAWEDGSPLMVIATDGGLLERPVQRDYVTLSPAERVELWVDFSQWDVGSELRLKSLAFSGVENMMGGMMGGRGMGGPMGGRGRRRGSPGASWDIQDVFSGQALPNGAEFDVLRVRVKSRVEGSSTLPERLSTIGRYRAGEAVNRNNPRSFNLGMQRMSWTINGRTFEMDEVARDEIVRLGDLELWEFINASSGMGMMGGMMQMPHPMHIHGLQFQVLDRQVTSGFSDGWESVRHGYVDEGWKDTVLVMSGERVRLLIKFEDYSGVYLYHCHNLEHEDLGMMRNYRIDA
jgi:blue copper oxidase